MRHRPSDAEISEAVKENLNPNPFGGGSWASSKGLGSLGKLGRAVPWLSNTPGHPPLPAHPGLGPSCHYLELR